MQRFERKFQLWDYWVSHSQLLVRSPGDRQLPATSPQSRNIDLIFVSVDYVELPALMWELDLVDPTEEDVRRAEQSLDRPVAPEHVFVFAYRGRRHLIVAGRMDIAENDLELMQTTLSRGPYGR